MDEEARGRRGGSLSTRGTYSGVVGGVGSAVTAVVPRSLEQRTEGGGGGRGGLGSKHCALRPVHNGPFFNFFLQKGGLAIF